MCSSDLDHLVIDVDGDASIRMNLGELETATTYGLPIKVLVLNNFGDGMVRQWQKLYYKGRMAFWGGFYEKIFGFREVRYFDIKGEYTGLTSRAMTAPDGLIRIPLNEESGKTGGQIEEFLMQFNGEGIQHVALLSDDLMASVDALQMAGVPLMTAPNDIYYEMLQERLPGHGEPTAELQARGILLDGSTAKGGKRLLLQIFSQCLLGPVFFEFIQRKNDEGFGEGNFKALFESLERDQLRRGAVQVDERSS